MPRFSPLLLATALILVSPVHAVMASDLASDSIKAQAGCYEVTFQFKETELLDPNTTYRSPDYEEHGLEWVTVDQDLPGKIALQHVLVTPMGPLKHWRQAWQFQPTAVQEFKGDSHWVLNPITTTEAQGKWLQQVTQVDDSPRYECAAPWNFSAANAYWDCTTGSPLPRREFSQRSDYNVLLRGNRHEITAWGWIHHQNNIKLRVKNGIETPIAREEGANTYKRVEDARCESAQTFWKERGPIWNQVQWVWEHVREHHQDLTLRGRLDGKLLWEKLFELSDAIAAQASWTEEEVRERAHAIIHEFVVH